VYSKQLDGSSPGGVITSNTYNYYFDNLTTTPAVTAVSFSLAASNAQVSGINIIYGIATATITASASNLGNYFYSDPLMMYTLTIGSNTVGSNTNLPPPGTNQITGIVTFINTNLNSVNITTSNIYTTYAQVAAVAHNPNSNSVTSSFYVSTIADGPSYSLVAAGSPTIPTTIPTLTTSGAVSGARCWSAGSALTTVTNINTATLNAPTSVPGYSFSGLTTIGNTSNYASVLYSQKWYLTDSGANNGGYDATTELQVADGRFITQYTTSDGTTRIGYKDYHTYYGNTSVSPALVNYTTISGGYRYTTFVWKLAGNPAGLSYGSGTMTFTLNNVRNIVQDGGNPAFLKTSAGNPLYILYRLEDTANIYPTPNGSGFYQFDNATPTSIWLNGNALDAGANQGPVTNTTYNLLLTNNYPTSTYVRGGFKITGVSGANVTIQVGLPTFTVYTNTVYVYCKIGLPMSDDVYFSHVSASFP
jgi:hypothetical protein